MNGVLAREALDCRRRSNAASRRCFARISGPLPRNRTAMIELNPIRQRIADLQGRVESLRGYL